MRDYLPTLFAFYVNTVIWIKWPPTSYGEWLLLIGSYVFGLGVLLLITIARLSGSNSQA